jgi:hypothetical protein
MKTAQPIRSDGEHGTLTGVTVTEDGQSRTVRIPTGELVWFTPQTEDAGTFERAHSQFPESVLVMEMGVRPFPVIQLRDDDSRISEWAALVADGTITPEMLADVPEPVEQVVERLRAEALLRLETWWDALIAQGATAQGITVPIDKEYGPILKNQALSVQFQMLTGSPPEEVKVYDIDGKPHTLQLAAYLSAVQEIQAEITSHEAEWDSRIAALAACTTPEHFAALGW